jgi:hypothetical protein
MIMPGEPKLGGKWAKIVFVACVEVLLAGIFGYVVRAGSGWMLTVFASLLGVLFAGGVVVRSMFQVSRSTAAAVALLDALVLGAVLGLRAELLFVAGLGAFSVVLMVADHTVREELREGMRIRMARISMRGSRTILAGLSLTLALVLASSFRAGGFTVSESVIDTLLGSAEPVLVRLVPGASFSLPFDENLSALARRELGEEAAAGNIAEAVESLEESIRNATGAAFTGKESTKEVLRLTLESWVETFSPLVQTGIILVVTVLAFFAFRSIATLIAPLAVAVASGYFGILRTTGFVSVGHESVEREVVVVP